MRRTKIVIVAITLLAISTMVLLLNTKVQNTLVQMLHHKELKSYKLLAYNSITSPTYEIKNVIHGSLDGQIMFDTLHKVFVMGTNKMLAVGYKINTFWKVNNHGHILDSVTVPNSFALDKNGLISNEKQYLNWVHTGEKDIKTLTNESKNTPFTLQKITTEELQQFSEVSLKRSYFFRRKQKNGNFIILRPYSKNEVKGYEGPAYFDLKYYGEAMKFKAYDFESAEGPKSYLYLWAAPKGYESPKIHFLYLPDIIHLPHYSEAGIYVIRPKGTPSTDVVDEHINGFFETSTSGQDFALSETDQSLKLNMKTFIPLTELSSFKAVNIGGQNKLALTFSPRGTAQFKAMTGRNLQMPIALVIEGRIVLAPQVSTQINDGKIDLAAYDEEELEHILELLDEHKE